MSKTYDIVIIGGGPGGMAAGIYAARAKLSAVVLEASPFMGGQCANTEKIENYPGFLETTGADLAEAFKKHAQKFGVEFVRARVEKIEAPENSAVRLVHTASETYECKAVIVATGATPRNIGCKGEAEHKGRGVSYCATCDGVFFEGKDVLVVGGGDAAVEEAMFLTKFASKVTIVHRRDALRAAALIQEKAFANPKMDFIWNSTIDEICGSPLVDSVKLKDTKTGEITVRPTDGVFVFIGQEPKTDFLNGLVKTNEQGYIIVNARMETDVKGIYAVGDVIQKESRQVVTAVADGALAGIWAGTYIESIKK